MTLGLSGPPLSPPAPRPPILARARLTFRDALRGLRTGRGTTTLAFLILALTMAAATVTFSVVDAVALRPLPFGEPDRLVSLMSPYAAGKSVPSSPADYFDWVARTHTFEGLGASRPGGVFQLSDQGVTGTLTARNVTVNLFDILRVRPAAGRLFRPDDERSDAAPVVVLTDACWARLFNRDSAVIGRTLTFDRGARTVIGVLPQGVDFPISAADAYIPYVATPAERTNNRGYSMSVVGRRRPGVTFEQARADVQAFSSAIVEPLHDQVVGPAKTSMLLVLAAVGCVLLVACVNVASLLLARAATRTREFATRAALGASRRRLTLGLVLEGLMLAIAAVAAGLVLSWWGLGVARSLLPPGLTRVSAIAINARVLWTSIGAAMLCGMCFSSAPAWLAGRSDVMSLMKSGGGAVIGGRGSRRSLSAFLVADIAFVSVLLVATTLVVSSFVVVTTKDLGFDRQNVVAIWYNRPLGEIGKADPASVVASIRAEVLSRARSVPGVVSAALTDGGTPMSGSSGRYGVDIPGYGPTRGEDMLETRAVTQDYFHLMGIDLVRGRSFESSDRLGAPQVMLINSVAAARFFRDRDPIGQVIDHFGPTTIIGVVGATSVDGPETDPRPEMFTLLDQRAYRDRLASRAEPAEFGNLIVRTLRDARGLAPAVREAIRPALGGLDAVQTTFIDDDFRRVTASRRFNAALMTTFGLIAVAIGAIGVYGTMAFVVSQQVRAIGLRMALGASPARVLRDVLQSALGRVAIGVVVGLATAWAVSNVFASFVFGVRTTEPLIYAGVACFLAVVGIAAALVPGRRAARIDPLTALRTE